MTRATTLLLALALAACAESAAQDTTRYEHGVFEYQILRGGESRFQERHLWTTAAAEKEATNVQGLINELGIKAGGKTDRQARMQIVDHFSAQGWELLTRTDIAFVLSEATGVAERYIFRRKR